MTALDVDQVSCIFEASILPVGCLPFYDARGIVNSDDFHFDRFPLNFIIKMERESLNAHRSERLLDRFLVRTQFEKS